MANRKGGNGKDTSADRSQDILTVGSISVECVHELLKDAPLPFALVSSRGRVITCNQAFSRIFGMYPEEACGLDLIKLSTEPSKIRRFIGDLKRGRAGEFEYKMKLDSKTKVVILHGWKASDEPEKVFVVTVQDPEILQLKRGIRSLKRELSGTKKKLGDIKNRYRKVLECSNEIIFVLDSRMHIKEASPLAESTLGCKPEELSGRRFDSILSPKSYPQFESAVEQVRQSLRPAAVAEVKLVSKKETGKSEVSFLLHIVPITSRTHSEPWFVITAKSPVRLSASELTELESHKSYQNLFEQASDGIVLLSPRGTVLNCNKRASELFGCSKAELIGKPVHGFLGEETFDLILKNIDMMERGEQVLPFEAMAVCKDGQRIPIEVSVSGVHNSQGELVTIQCFIRDISTRKQLEQQLFQAQKMESLGLLAGGIAHDFNNLLGGILGYATFAQTIIDKHHRAQKALSTIIEAAKRAADLTQQLLTFAKEGNVEYEPVDINQLVRETVDLFKRSITAPIKISLKLERDIFVVNASRAQVQQVILNILANARDAMPEGGEIKIVTKNYPAPQANREVPRLQPNGDYVKISISDTGRGIPQELVGRIFEPFFTTKDKRESTGLGLSIVYNTMERHNGYVGVETNPGGGATFSLYFPAEASKKVRKSRSSRRAPGGHELILVVDDEEMIVNLASDILRNAGYQVLTATTAKKALDTFKKHADRIDLVLLDVVMPGTTGQELLAKMRSIRPDIKAVISSGYTLESEEINTGNLDGEFFIQKPYEIGELLRIVRKALDRKEHVASSKSV